MKWYTKIAIGLFVVYIVIARWCDFKVSIGLVSTACECYHAQG